VAYCWGSNAFGSIGDGTQTNRLVPTPVSFGLPFQQIATGGQVTCGITTDGIPYCWGDNSAQQLGVGRTPVSVCPSTLGNPDFSCSPGPVRVAGGFTFASITAGAAHACGLTLGGQLYCWGTSENFGSQDGLDSLPVLAGGSLLFSNASAGAVHTCAAAGSTIYCWGNETQYGVIGDGAVNQTVNTPGQVLLGAYYVTAGFLGSCALGSNGGPTVGYCWGYNVEGGVGNGGTSAQTTPFPVFGNQTVTAIGTSGHHACAINVTRQVYCWGWNTWGQLGLGGGSDQYSETLVRP
jgi:alpha-tubulin suppressor-like RCC1 family protein